MTIIEHLTELRRRVMICLLAVGAAAIVGWVFYGPIFDFLRHSYVSACRGLPPVQHPPKGCDQLFGTSVIEPFLVRFKVSVFTGLAIALPIVLFQLWRFVTPGLTPRERKLTIPFVLSSLLLFALGGWFAFLTLPRGLRFLLGVGGTTIVPIITAGRYISFVLLLTFAFGISFEFPLVLIFLSWVGVVSSRRLRSWRRYAYLLITVFAAVITPSQDPYTQLAMMLPMILFYEVAILVARALKR
jgi:sec-independent protein translocase protein TatC